jgi:hypothetical protein
MEVRMAWNRLFLNGDQQEIPLGFSAWVVGTGAQETLDITSGIDASFNAGNGDHVKLSGSIDDYAITMRGAQIEFLSQIDDSVVTLSVNGDSMVEFDEGVADLSLSFSAQGPQITLGNAVISDGETLEEPAIAVYGEPQGPVDVLMDELSEFDANDPFDAGEGDFIFFLDAGVDFVSWITGFDEGDTLLFANSPSGTTEDFYVTNPAFGDGEAAVGMGATEITLLGLSSDMFANADSFMGIFGQESLALA